jgi:hypothetical protein
MVTANSARRMINVHHRRVNAYPALGSTGQQQQQTALASACTVDIRTDTKSTVPPCDSTILFTDEEKDVLRSSVSADQLPGACAYVLVVLYMLGLKLLVISLCCVPDR